MAKQQFSVDGTSCKSCEVVIERQLKKQSDVKMVEVSHGKRLLSLETQGERRYSEKELNDLLGSHGYSFKATSGHSAPRASARVNWRRVGAALILTVGLYLFLDATGLLRLSPSSSEPSGLLGVLVVGLIASVSSCTAVVGGLVAAVSGAMAKDQQPRTPAQRLYPHLLFNIGRVGGFFVLGALVGVVGSVLQLNPALNGLFMVAVAALMILIGINLMEVFPASVFGMPKWLAHRVHELAESKNPFAPMMLGAATFFLPCGFTQSMQLLALSTQDPLISGAIMGTFALGTVPVLLGIGGAASYAKGKTLTYVVQGAGLLVLVLGLSNVLNGMTLLGFNTDVFSRSGADRQGQAAVLNGQRQVIEMEVTSWGSYEPNVITVQEGVPVDWNITGAKFMGCADTLVLPAFGVNARLKTGPNLVQFTPKKAGTYTFSCSMGMIRGTLVVTPSA